MRLAITLLGLDLLTVELDTSDGDNGSDPGDCTTYPVGFVPRMEKPHEVDTPDRDW